MKIRPLPRTYQHISRLYKDENIGIAACSWTDYPKEQPDFLKDFLKNLEARKDEQPKQWKWLLIKAAAALAERNSPYAYKLALDFKLPLAETIKWLMQKYEKSKDDKLIKTIRRLQDLESRLLETEKSKT
jgi:hypothetical protein